MVSIQRTYSINILHIRLHHRPGHIFPMESLDQIVFAHVMMLRARLTAAKVVDLHMRRRNARESNRQCPLRSRLRRRFAREIQLCPCGRHRQHCAMRWSLRHWARIHRKPKNFDKWADSDVGMQWYDGAVRCKIICLAERYACSGECVQKNPR